MHRIVVPVRHRGRAPYRASLAVLTLFLAAIIAFGGDTALIASAAARPKDDPARTSRDKEDLETEREDDPASTGRDNGGQQTEAERNSEAAVEEEEASKKKTTRRDDQEATARDKGGVEAQAVKVFSNATSIRGPGASAGPGNPYPSTIQVSGLETAITDVNVTLRNFAHTVADDFDVLLVGPQSQTAVIMSDVGGRSDVTNLTLQLNDEASEPMPDAVPPFPATGNLTFKPTNGSGQGTESYPSPAPPAGAGSALSVFDGTNPNGPWRLFVVDDLSGEIGQFAGGWSLTITTANGAPQANPDRFTAKAGRTLRRAAPGVLANDSDPDGNLLGATVVKRTRHGTVQLEKSGAFTYRSKKDFAGKDTFVYALSDSSGLSDTAKVTIKVKGRRR